MSTPTQDEKARQAILYVSRKMETAAGFGSVLLNKVLYFMDHTQYVKTGETITGFSYIKQLRGPTPNPAQFLPLKNDMVEKREIREKSVEKFGFIQKRVIAIAHADVSKFAPEEIALMDEVIETFMDVSATAASDLTHDMLAWKIAVLKEELPHFTYLLSQADLTDEDLRWGEEAIAKFKAA